jgi:hypothetical protein
VLTTEQRDELATVGHTRLPGVLDRATVTAIADRVWEHLVRKGIDRHDPTTWPAGFQAKLQGLRQARVFDAFGTAGGIVTGAVDEILGRRRGPEDANAWGPALFTFPERIPWLLPHATWHLDLPGRGDPDRPAQARLFGYVTDVVPWGGGTLVVEGSHELVRRMVAAAPKHDAGSSAMVRRRLREAHPWFEALFQPDEHPAARIRRFMVDGEEVDGVRLRVAELTADAGDVVVMLPWTLHSASTNAAARPRMMVTHTIHR